MSSRYRLEVRGPVSPELLELLEKTTVGESGTSSILTCDIVDQARLQGVLGWLREEGVELVSLEPVERP
jgi:hypothetical protein